MNIKQLIHCEQFLDDKINYMYKLLRYNDLYLGKVAFSTLYEKSSAWLANVVPCYGLAAVSSNVEEDVLEPFVGVLQVSLLFIASRSKVTVPLSASTRASFTSDIWRLTSPMV